MVLQSQQEKQTHISVFSHQTEGLGVLRFSFKHQAGKKIAVWSFEIWHSVCSFPIAVILYFILVFLPSFICFLILEKESLLMVVGVGFVVWGFFGLFVGFVLFFGFVLFSHLRPY